ncbi:MAG: Asd/ArgC dimerization domain-containing protein [Candidatus Polarisedimenticolia bacterium]
MGGDAQVPGVQTGTRLAFFGSMTLLAREMRAVLEKRPFLVTDVRLYDAAGEGALSEYAGEALVVSRPDEDAILGLDIAFYCGTTAEMAPYLDWPARRGFTAIDLSGASLDRPDVPLIHTDINAADLGRAGAAVPLVAAPHAISHNIATLAAASAEAGALKAIRAVALRPASEMGEAGIEELQRQTVGLLNFHEVPHDVFGRQMAFNIIPSRGMAAIEAVVLEPRIRREAALLSRLDVASVSLATAFVPVFHGHALHLTLEFEQAVTMAALESSLRQARGVRLVEDPAEFSPVDLAGEESVAVSAMPIDGGASRVVMLWSFCDNLRGGAALNAIRIAERVADLRQGMGR